MNKILSIVTLFVLVVPAIWGQDTVTDIDGNVYETVQIGEQLWMKENLKVTHYRNGDEIPTGYSDDDWVNLTTGAFAVYDDDIRLYPGSASHALLHGVSMHCGIALSTGT